MASDPRNLTQQFVQMLHAFRLSGEASSFLNTALAEIGWDMDALKQSGAAGENAATHLKEQMRAFAALYPKLLALIEQFDPQSPPATYEQFVQALITINESLKIVEQLSEGASLPAAIPDPAGQFEQIGSDLIDWVQGALIRHAHPALNELLELLTIVDHPGLREPLPAVVDATGRVMRRPVAFAELDLSRILDLVADPIAALKPAYMPQAADGTFQFVSQADLEQVADRLFGHLHALCHLLGLPTTYGYNQGYRPDLGPATDFAQRMFTVYLPETGGKQMDITFALSPKDFGGLGLTIFFFGDKITDPIVFGDWQITFTFSDESVEGIALGTERALIMPDSVISFATSVAVARKDGSAETEFVLGDKAFSHLLVQMPAFTAGVNVNGENYGYTLGVDLGHGAFVVEHLLNATWNDLKVDYDGANDTTRLAFQGLKLDLPFIANLFDIEVNLTLVYQKGILQSVSTIDFIQPQLGALSLENFGWKQESFNVQITDPGLVVEVGKADFAIVDEWALGWEKLSLTFGVGQNIRLQATALYLETGIANIKIVADFELISEGGAFKPDNSSFTLRQPALAGEDLPWENLAVSEDGVTITFGKTAPIAITNDLQIGWEQFALKFSSDGTLEVSFDRLKVTVSDYEILVSFTATFSKSASSLTSFTLHKPDLGTLDLGQSRFYLDERVFALQLQSADIARWLGRVAPNLGDDGLSGTLTLRVFFDDGDKLVQQVRLDWQPQDTRTLRLPGIAVTLPEQTLYTIALYDDNSQRKIAALVTVDANKEVVAKSSFVWGRGEGENNERELQNDRDKAAPENEILTVTVAPSEKLTIALAILRGDKLPSFFRLLETGLLPPDFSDEDMLGTVTKIEVGAPGARLTGRLRLGDMVLPFLQPANAGQNIQVGPVPTDVNLESDADDLVATFAIPVTVKLGSALALSGTFDVGFTLTNFALKVDHGNGLDFFVKDESLDGELLGLRWRFKGKEVTKEGQPPVYHVAKLTTDKYDYRVVQAEGCSLYLDFLPLGEDPITFKVENFQLSEAGITLRAEVLPRPARLNGLDTKFTFAGSGFDIVENRIQSFTLKGSGPLPPALVGEATTDVELEFEQVGSALTLKAGSAKLQTEKPLKCPGTRFQFTITAMGLKFHYDGKYHLYFTLSGDAQFVPQTGDDPHSALAFLSAIKITLVDCPLTGDASVIMQHVNFLIKLPIPKTFNFLGCFEMEVRGIAFLPQAKVFNGDGAMQVTGQLRFAQGKGDNKNDDVDLHSLYIGLPAKGEFIPRIHFTALPVSISFGDAFELTGIVHYFDEIAEEGMIGRKGFTGEGILKMQGMPTIEASFAFLRVQRDPASPWVRAWFIYIGVRRISFRVPIINIFLREVGLGFGYRYTLVSIKRADEIDDLALLLRELRQLSRTQGNLHQISSWAVDIEERNKSPRWTIAMRALFSQNSAAVGLTDWNAELEKKQENLFLIDAVAALRSDLTFFMAVRVWLNTNYYAMDADPSLRDIPLFSGFVLLSPKKRRFLAHLASNPDGHTGSNPEMPDFFKKAIKNSQFSATLLIEPGLVHYEMGWPNQLRWSDNFGPLKAEFRGGFIVRVSKSEFVIGSSFLARASLQVGASLDLGFVGASIAAVATVAFGARYIGVIGFKDPLNASGFYGAIGLEARIDFRAEAWIRFEIRINLGFKKIRIAIEIRVKFVLQIDFTAAIEVGILLPANTGIRGSGTVSVPALGHRIELTASFALNDGAVTTARGMTEKFLQYGLEAADVEPVPGVSAQSSLAARRNMVARNIELTMGAASTELASADVSEETDTGDIVADVEPPFTTPDYIFYVIREPADKDHQNDNTIRSDKRRCYFLLMPEGEKSPGFLPTPPSIDFAHITEDFRLQIPKLPAGVKVEQYKPTSGQWEKVEWQDGSGESKFFTWKANWAAKILEGDQLKEQKDEETGQASEATSVDLANYILQAYILGVKNVPGDDGSADGNTTLVAVQDPPFVGISKDKLADERVHNPSENVYESAVRGAFEQFRGSPYFKRDPNSLYDNILEEAFSPETSIYAKDGLVSNSNGTNGAASERSIAQARQFRGSIVEALIGDARAYALAPVKPDPANMPAQQLGLLFRIEVDQDANGRPILPDWLDGFAGGASIRQRLGIETTTVTNDEGAVRPFNVSAASFDINPPLFDRVQHFTDANTVAITWDLKWTTPLVDDNASDAQEEPEQHLCYYEVRRRSLDTNEPEVVRERNAVEILHRKKGDSVLIVLTPRFKVVDHFSHETLEEQAALPVTGRSYLYTITPIDYGGARGRPLTIAATRYPNEPPQVPVDAELRVNYELPLVDAIANVAGDLVDDDQQIIFPELLEPSALLIEWTEPQVVREGPRVAVEEYRLIFRRNDTLPIGSYGLDSSVQGARTKSLAISNTRPLPGDIVILISASGPRSKRSACVEVDTLLKAGVLPSSEDKEDKVGNWQPVAWRVYIQTVAINGVPSALAPVKLVLQVSNPSPSSDEVEERQPAELEWLPNPFSARFRLSYLPPEDLSGIPGDVYVPMPDVVGSEDMRFAGSTDDLAKEVLGKVKYKRHPDALRCVRFLWNQGPSDRPNYPLDLHAGYYLQQLDIDANTVGTFTNAERLANALTDIQEVQMIPPDDLYVTPGDTLTVSQWEAWYPSAMQRLRTTPVGEMAPPWYSWRESRLLWPAWPAESTPTPEEGNSNKRFFHPLLRQMLDALATQYGIDLQAINATRATTLTDMMAMSAPKGDPYGWGILQRFGLSVTLGLRDPDTNELLRGSALIKALGTVLNALPQQLQQEYSNHLHVELLVQPAKSVELQTSTTLDETRLLALAQISLRPVVEQVQHYGRLEIVGPPKAEITLVFAAAVKSRSLVIQSVRRGDGEQKSVTISQLELEAGKRIEHAFALPLNGRANILLRGAKEDMGVKEVEVWFALQHPLRTPQDEADMPEIDWAKVNTHFNTYFILPSTAAGSKDPKGHIRWNPASGKPTADEMQLLRHKFKGEADRKLVNARIDPINAIPKPFQVTDVPDGALTSYFTAPERVTGYDVVPPIDDHGQWDHFVGYVKRLLQDEMKPLPTGKELKEVVLTYFVWAQRFFDAGGAISVQHGAAQTGSGPWLATAYPRTGTPAYVTPDANGRLQYDHLMGDRWAHNYRYYIRPYSRYDRLWRSFYESDKLLSPTSPATELLEILDYRPDPDQAALDIVLDRTYPIDKPVVLRSARLDLELPGQAVTPGSTWEVIVARHWEQNAIERNKTLERQLTFRRISYSLVRRFSFQNHIEGLKRALATQKADGPSYVLNPDVVSNHYPAIPSSYLPAPATNNPDTHDVNESLALALPERMNRFQEDALVIQWGRLLYYYEHKLILVAQTTTDVSPVNAIVQRDFEYVTPKAKATATWVEEGGDFVLAVSLQLARYWDCLPPNAKKMWQIEDADKPIAEGDSDPQHLKLSALPDLEVVYLIAERYMGNLEVQHEISFQADRKEQPFQALLRAGQRFKAIDEIKIAPPPAPTDYFTLHFTLRPAEGGKFEAGTDTHGRFTIAPTLPDSLQDELRFEPQGDGTFTTTYTGFMTEEKAKALFALFADAKDRKAVQELYNRNVSATRRGTLNIRTLRGSTQPETLAFTAPELAAS